MKDLLKGTQNDHSGDIIFIWNGGCWDICWDSGHGWSSKSAPREISERAKVMNTKEALHYVSAEIKDDIEKMGLEILEQDFDSKYTCDPQVLIYKPDNTKYGRCILSIFSATEDEEALDEQVDSVGVIVFADDEGHRQYNKDFGVPNGIDALISDIKLMTEVKVFDSLEEKLEEMEYQKGF